MLRRTLSSADSARSLARASASACQSGALQYVNNKGWQIGRGLTRQN
jgi:hypothetical protein